MSVVPIARPVGEIIPIGSVQDFHRSIAPRHDTGPTPEEHARQAAELAGITAPVEQPWLATVALTGEPAPQRASAATPTSDPAAAWHAALEQAERDRTAKPHVPVFDEPRPLAAPPILERSSNG
ncbi:MAG: hypothetical protein U1E37_02735 [Sphingomonadaceae bacterium]